MQLCVKDLLVYDHVDPSVHWGMIVSGHICMANKGMTTS